MLQKLTKQKSKKSVFGGIVWRHSCKQDKNWNMQRIAQRLALKEWRIDWAT